VGVRLKGSSTYQDLECSDGYCKAAFKIKLDEYQDDQRYGDVERVTLNNMTTDTTQSKEVIVYNLLNEHSQLASRASYARVTLNGEDWGLYANVESADERFLERRFADASGNLWGTGADHGDFRPEFFDSGWVIKSGPGDTAQLVAVSEALDRPRGDFFGTLGEVVDTEEFLDYWAWCVAIGNYDGYPFHLNDVLVYEDPQAARRLLFAPWGTDESWDEYEATGQSWDVVYGRIGFACFDDEACVEALRARIAEALDAYDEADVLARAQAAWDLTEADVQTDPVRPSTPEEVWAARDALAALIPTYSDYERERVGL
jgi:spore coat protein CotH